jgi:hypothetical protein
MDKHDDLTTFAEQADEIVAADGGPDSFPAQAPLT